MTINKVASDDDESSKESEENSATEISTDSEFDHDGVTPTQHEIPEITINDSFVRKTRGNYAEPKKVQVKSKIIAPANSNVRAKESKDKEENRFSQQQRDYSRKVVEANSKVAEREVAVGTPPRALVNPRKGDYLLNRTHSTEGIASKLSLELKKRYLLGGSGVAGSVMKSGSTSNVDTKLSNFTDAISQHQKLLNPAPEPSPTMQAFLHGTNKLRGNNVQLSPLSPTALLTSSTVRSLSASRNLAISDNETSSPYRPTTTRLISSANKPQEQDDELPDVLPEMPSVIMKSKTAPSIPCAEVAKGDMEKVAAKNLVDDPGSSGKKTTEPLDSLQSGDGDGDGGGNDIVASYKICSDEAGAGRPRSPLHEASIIVPTVIWSKSEDENKEASTEDYEIDSDSLSSDSEEAEEEARNERLISHLSPPRLQIHSTEGDLLLDEKMDEVNKDPDLDGAMFEPDSIECSALDEKSCCLPIVADHRSAKERTALEIEAVNNNLEQLELRDDARTIPDVSDCSSSTSVASAISNKQDDSEDNDVTTAALTETEFSEWARDGEALVSEDLRDAEFDINPEFVTIRKNGRTSTTTNSSVTSTTANANAMATSCKNAKFPVTTPTISMAKLEDLTDLEFDSSQLEKKADHPRNNATSNLLTNGENIDYMDTDNESLLDDSLQENSNAAVIKNRGYIEFVNIKTTVPSRQMMMMMGKVENAPIAELEGDNSPCSDEEKFNNENVIEINPVTMDDVMNRLNDKRNELAGNVSDANARQDISLESLEKGAFQSMDEDSLLIHEPNEDTTTSEVITILASPVNPQVPMIPMEVENTQAAELPKVVADSSNPDYLEYVKRLQSRIAEFSNAKDSIDVRKSKKKNFKSSIQARTAGMITEEIKKQESPTSDKLTPATTRKLEEIKKERFKEKNLVQDILMDKLEAHKQKSAEKKAKRAARTNSFTCGHVRSGIKLPVPVPATRNPSSTSGQEFVPTSIMSATSTPIHTTFAEAKKALAESLGETPNQNAMDLAQQPRGSATGSPGESDDKMVESGLSKSATDSKLSDFLDAERNFKTPVAPPRLKHEEAKRTAEKARQEARERARLKSDEDLGLSPEDKLKELRKLVARRQHSVEERKRSVQQVPAAEPRVRPNSFILSRPSLRLQTSKSTDNMKNIARKLNYEVLMSPNTKSMDELSHATNSSNLDTDTTTTTTTTSSVTKRDKKKTKDPERRKSIIQAVSDFFFKKDSSASPNPSPKDKLSMFRISTKTKGKIDKISPSKYEARPKSVSEDMILGNYHNEQPPPIPPPPMNYNASSVQVSDDSLSEEDTCGALSTSGMQKMTLNEESCNSIPRKLKSKKLARQAQMKRLRMAQEIQRKLEETEVKQRDLESRGVSVEKALRGEGECSEREEADLLREWFDLMKERTELRRYEKELLVRAQEVQLEDRHERLEQELRERLADDDGKKTSADVKKEGEILTEMLEIVAKRDSLIALLEEERQRYQDEERDLEAQMLAKGLRLTPIKKCGPMYSA